MQGQLKADLARLNTLQAQIDPATQQLAALQQQRMVLAADIQNLQGKKEELTKAQGDADALHAEIRALTKARNQLNEDLGQRVQLDEELKGLEQSIGQRRAEANQAATDRQKALDDRAVLERERMDLTAQLPMLRSQRDALQKEHDKTTEEAAVARSALEITLRARDAAEREVIRLRKLADQLAASTHSDTTREKQETN